MLSPGNPANSSIARACTLMGINLGGVVMGVNAIQRIGAFLWGLTFAESEDTPWESLNVDEGYEAEDSVLISFSGHIKLLGACVNEVMHATNLFEAFYPGNSKDLGGSLRFYLCAAASRLPVRQRHQDPWRVGFSILVLYDQSVGKTKSKGFQNDKP